MGFQAKCPDIHPKTCFLNVPVIYLASKFTHRGPIQLRAAIMFCVADIIFYKLETIFKNWMISHGIYFSSFSWKKKKSECMATELTFHYGNK